MSFSLSPLNSERSFDEADIDDNSVSDYRGGSPRNVFDLHHSGSEHSGQRKSFNGYDRMVYVFCFTEIEICLFFVIFG